MLVTDLEMKDILANIKDDFDKLIRFGSFILRKVKTEQDFEQFMLDFEQIIKSLDIEKLYNSTNRGKIREFEKMDLFKQFFYISTPLKTSKNFKFIKGGTCYNWALFFYNLFEKIDKKGKLDKKLISFQPTYDHGVFKVGFKNKKYIVDPYAKEKGLLTEIKKGNEIYLSAIDNVFLYGKVEDEKKLKLKVGENSFQPKIFDNTNDFIESIPATNELINIKTYLKGKNIHIIVKQDDEHIFVNYKGQQLYREKDFSITDIVGLYMEKSKISNLDILLALIGFDSSNLSKEMKEELGIIADKMNINFVFEKLGIEEDIKMFQN